MISRITLNGVASYKKEAVLETDKRVNLLYGLNGTGKSTFSEFLYNQSDVRFSQCSIDGLEENDEILVYNQSFVQDTFYEPQGIHGIFTLSKGNAKAQKLIDEAQNELRKLNEQKKKIEEKLEGDIQKHNDDIEEYQKQVWKIKTEYSGGDRVLEFCLDGKKGNKDTLFKYLLSIDQPESEIEYSIDDLKAEAQQIQGDAQPKTILPQLEVNVEAIEKSELLTKIIVGNKNSSVSALIEQLEISDWVSEGLDYIHVDGDKGVCPFCQKMTITRDFISQLNVYFDESYKQDKANIERMISVYENEINRALKELERIKSDSFLSSRVVEIDAIIVNIQTLVEQNINRLKEKVKNPSIQVSLSSLKESTDAINVIIDDANSEIAEYNRKIADIRGAKIAIKEKFWALMRKEYGSVIELYHSSEKAFKHMSKRTQSYIQEKQTEIDSKKKVIEDNRKITVNIDEAVENIKNGLIDIGITDFTIEKCSEENALYRLKRGESKEDVFKTLSEGEKMVISFLYFVELCKGEAVADRATNRKIIIIDDPISSLSHIHVFNIGRLIHNEFLRTEKYDQIFILTHSLYFFYELTNLDHKKRNETQKLTRICKNAESSYFEDMKYEDIQNDYQAYWHIVKDKKQAPALIANCMRNIIEYFFNFVEKQDLNQVFQKPELQKTSYMAFNRYMNRESHSKGQNIFDIKEFDYELFKEAFRKVFELEGYIGHYNKMMKI